MNIFGLVVCVNYSNLLAQSLHRWNAGCDGVVVITDTKDTQTFLLCQHLGVACFQTDIFYANGAAFNKGAAISEVVADLKLRIKLTDTWLLMFDADIIPPLDWRAQLEEASLVKGYLYGASRYWHPVEEPIIPTTEPIAYRKMPQGWVIGFFMLFHMADPHLPPEGKPLFDLHWPHAGNYDTVFCRRWPTENQCILPVPMIHFGNERENWCGVSPEAKAAMRTMLQTRRQHEDWERERMKNPPKI